MQDLVDELDLAIINCLQIRPRASWVHVGRVLEVDPVTVSRRWDRLVAQGLAWVTCFGHPNTNRVMAYIEVDVAGAHVHTVAEQVSSHPAVASVHHTTGARSLVLSVVGADPVAISHYVSDHLGTVEGIVATRSEMVTAIHGEASEWRLRTLSPSQRRALQTAYPRPSAPATTTAPSDDEYRIMQALATDGRMSTTDLARHLGVSEATARRRVNRLLGEGRAALRCEIAQEISGSPHTGLLWARAPLDVLDNVARSLSELPEVRACLSITGRNNLMLFTWLRNVGDLQRIERTVSGVAPELEVTDRAFCLRSVKRLGRLIDDRGRSAGVLPSATWEVETMP
ncbi:Lrp/AsnC family transcriptional regulator [Rhodococcus olei]|uniref:Lrp/AsnC family transcriptional regulator n=1 Tax=Rhodococcus olei TaxID=2161675 RepID=A0ABP8PFS8_9NOCA